MPQTVHELHSLREVAKVGNLMASSFKEFGAKEIDPHFDIPPYLVGFRGDDHRAGAIIEVICHEVDRDKGLEAAYILAAMECVAIAVTFDAHMATTDINPRTGKPWARGEMQKLCDGEGACDTGLLTDCLMTTAVFADGEIAGYNHSYHLHEGKREIAWVPDDDDPSNQEGVQMQGFVVDSLKGLVAEGRAKAAILMSGLAAKVAGFDMPIHPGAHRDAALIRVLSEQHSALVRVAPQIVRTGKERAVIERAVAECDNVQWMR